MSLTRRNFLAWAGLSAVGAVSCAIPRKEQELAIESPVRLPEDLVEGLDNWYATLCRQCPCAEGVLVRVMEGRAKKVQGNPVYPVNQGKQSVRCDGGLQALYHPHRLAGPMQRSGPRGSGQFQAISWDAALAALGQQLAANGSGMVLATEPLRAHLGLIAGRFAQAFGGKHLGFETLDQVTLRAALESVYQQPLLPDFDLAQANYLLSFGADFLSTWLSPTRYGQAYGQFRHGEGRKERGIHVQVEPRFSMTAANADRWIPIGPGWEGHLALSMAQVIISEGLQAPGVNINAITGGKGAAALEPFRPEAVAGKIGLPEGLLEGHSAADVIKELARDFAKHRPSLAVGGGSAGAHSNGLFNLKAIYALNYLVGSVGTAGGVKFNAGLPLNELPSNASVGSLADWKKVAADINSGATKLLMVHQADLAYGLPASVGMVQAFQREGLFIASFSTFLDETSAQADLILPDRVYLEDWGSDVPDPAPGYPVLGVQQPVVNPLSDYDPRSFGDVLLAVAQQQGKAANLPWATLRDALRESSDKLFALRRGSIRAGSADEFWRTMLQRGGWWDESAGIRNVAAPSAPAGLLAQIAGEAAAPVFSGPEAESFHLLPFSHNSLLDGRNSHLPWAQGAPDPVTTVTWQTWVELNEHKAKEMGLREGDVVKVESAAGSISGLTYLNPALPPDVVGIPLGQGRRHGSEYASGRLPEESSNVMDLLDGAQVQGSGGLAWAAARVRVTATGTSRRVSKFEGTSMAREIGETPGERIIHITSPSNSGGH
ncbi:MAG: 4Fe-4S ferredoxin [SAR202 cluster bacterium]|nr:4Fe-4S ferredoxin [SAR202 cluster bacterium]